MLHCRVFGGEIKLLHLVTPGLRLFLEEILIYFKAMAKYELITRWGREKDRPFYRLTHPRLSLPPDPRTIGSP